MGKTRPLVLSPTPGFDQVRNKLNALSQKTFHYLCKIQLDLRERTYLEGLH